VIGTRHRCIVHTAQRLLRCGEFALVKVRATQLHDRARKGDRRAVLANQVISRLDRYLGVTQLGVTLASLGLGWIGEPAITHVFEDAGVALTGQTLTEYPHLVVVALAFVSSDFASRPLRRAGAQARGHPTAPSRRLFSSLTRCASSTSRCDHCFGSSRRLRESSCVQWVFPQTLATTACFPRPRF